MITKKFNVKRYFTFSFFFIIILYLIYKSEISLNGNFRIYYIKYLIFLIPALLIYFFLDKYKKKLFENFLFVAFFILYLAEFIFTLQYVNNYHYIDYQYYINLYENENKLKFDKRVINEIYNEERINNPNIALSIGSTELLKDKNLKLLPLGGKSNSFTIGCNLNGQWIKYTSDRYGFNNPDYVWANKNPNISNVMLFGNTEVHSNCLERPYDIASLLRKKTQNKFNFFNMAINSNGPLTNFGILKEYSVVVKPDHIIWFFDEDTEIEFLLSNLKNPILQKYFTDKNFLQKLSTKQKKIDKIVEKKINTKLLAEDKKEKDIYKINIAKITKFIKLNYLRSYTVEKYFSELSYRSQVDILIPDEMNKLFNLISEFATKNNSKVHLVFLPSYKRFFTEKGKNIDFSNQLFAMAKENKFNIINLIPDFENYRNSKRLYAVKYYNGNSKKANELISKIILQKLD